MNAAVNFRVTVNLIDRTNSIAKKLCYIQITLDIKCQM